MYLDWRGEWRLPVLNGIASVPLLRDDGGTYCAEGYDPTSGMYLEKVPDLRGVLPERPSRSDAEGALHLIRKTFSTFCFADARTQVEPAGLLRVDITQAPGRDESAFLAAPVLVP
jgi:hypothetical protein